MDDKIGFEGTVNMVHSLARNVRAIMNKVTFGTDHLNAQSDLHVSTIDKRFGDGDFDFVAEHMTNNKPIKTSPLPRYKDKTQGVRGSNSAIRQRPPGKYQDSTNTGQESTLPSEKEMMASYDRYGGFDIDGIETFLKSRGAFSKIRDGRSRTSENIGSKTREKYEARNTPNQEELEANKTSMVDRTSKRLDMPTYQPTMVAAVTVHDNADNKPRYSERLKSENEDSSKPSNTKDVLYVGNEKENAQFTLTLNKARIRNAATKASRCLFNLEERQRNTDKEIYIKSTVRNGLYNCKGTMKDLDTDNESMKEFENDLVFLSKCGNKMSTPAKSRQEIATADDEITLDDKNNNYQHDSDFQNSQLLNTAYRVLDKSPYSNKTVNDRELSPRWKSRQAPTESQSVSAEISSTTTIFKRGSESLRQNININPLPSLTSLWNPSKCIRSKTGSSYPVPTLNPIFQTQIRRCLPFTPPISPVSFPQTHKRHTDSSKRFEPSNTVDSQQSLPCFKSEDEEAVYYLITKYLNKDGDYY